jgi:branched-chain amino acid transport system permease protein
MAGKLVERRSALITAGAGALVLLVCTVAFPKPAPMGVLLDGAIGGCRTALVAAGVILIYRSARIVNFAQLALGSLGSALVFNLSAVGIRNVGHVPFAVSFVIALLASVLLGAAIELLFVRRFFDAPRLVVTVVTIVAAPTIASLAGKVPSIDVWNKGQEFVAIRSNGHYVGPFAGAKVHVFPLAFGFPALLTVVLTIVSFGGLALFFHRSRLGVAVRGTAENADRALLLGINVKLLSTLVWGVAGLLSGFAAITASLDKGSSGTTAADFLPALAAVVLGRTRSMPQTVVAALAIGVVRTSLAWSYPSSVAFDALMVVVLVGGLYLQRTTYTRVDASATSWRATQELRPTPKELLDVPGLRLLRRGLFGVVAVTIVVFPLAFSVNQVTLGAHMAVNVIVALSLVVLTGWGGQVSLGQFALVGIGAMFASKLTADVGVSFWLALPLTMAFTVGVALVVGQPALRIRGPFLAVTTLAFAVFVERVVFGSAAFKAFLPDAPVERPSLLFVSFGSERNYYYLCVAFAVASTVVVRRLRAGRPGRVLIAVREDEFGVQPFGVNAARSRLQVFALAGALAGLAGVLFVHQQRSLSPAAYGAQASVDAFVMTMIGGISSVSGAVLGATYSGLVGFLIPDEQIQRLANSGGLLVLLFAAPGGLASLLYAVRDSIYRIVATRRRIAVPSLFGDVVPEKTQLGVRVEGRGLEAVPASKRYRLPSVLYR